MRPTQNRLFCLLIVFNFYWVSVPATVKSQEKKIFMMEGSLLRPIGQGKSIAQNNEVESMMTDAELMEGNRTSKKWVNVAEKSRAMNLEQLSEAISTYDDDFSTLFKVLSSDSPMLTWYEFPSMVVDPKIERIYRMLQEKPAKEAATISEKMFRQKLANLKRSWKSSTDISSEHFPFDLHGLFASAFFCVQFCDVETVDELICEWIMFQRSRFKIFAGQNDSSTYVFEREVGPNTLGLINLYYCALLKQGVPREEVQGRFNRILEPYGEKLPDFVLGHLAD